ncbi:glycosyltransferase family 4 protein [Anabaena catenula]|uniref:Glycosyltransferase family 4 protein n=1 Tax=Anabaena catenula FACHB-362 TaxID=2692877 RepID=A0ABR8IYS5_9NOST|nr:glycosyltransferase family 4 protein [Anabaena catenula]MBD2690453.1 glycosyltransferase family 4 protein [Anabaena catenula FACHB-362]
MKIKVALLYFCFDDYTIELANSLVNYVDLTLIQQEKSSNACKGVLDPRIPVLTFKKPDMRYPSNILAMGEMMRLIDKVAPDVLHVQETNDIWYLSTLLLNKMPPLVTTIHDLFSHPGDKQKVFASDYTRPIAFYRSQQLIVHTHIHKKTLNEKFRIPNHHINVLPHGELGSLYKRRVSNNDNIAKEPYTLLFFGRIWPYKGLKYLIEAMPLIAEQIPEVKLIIAGRGENMEQYFPDGYNSQHYEILNHFISDQEVVSLFARSTITVLPYIEASQSGVAALSYGMGTPVVASDLGGLSEIVRHQQDGLLVPPRDVNALAESIISLLKDNQLYKKIQNATITRCQEDLNWSNIAEQTLAVYHQLALTKSSKFY